MTNKVYVISGKALEWKPLAVIAGSAIVGIGATLGLAQMGPRYFEVFAIWLGATWAFLSLTVMVDHFRKLPARRIDTQLEVGNIEEALRFFERPPLPPQHLVRAIRMYQEHLQRQQAASQQQAQQPIPEAEQKLAEEIKETQQQSAKNGGPQDELNT